MIRYLKNWAGLQVSIAGLEIVYTHLCRASISLQMHIKQLQQVLISVTKMMALCQSWLMWEGVCIYSRLGVNGRRLLFGCDVKFKWWHKHDSDCVASEGIDKLWRRTSHVDSVA